jgi:hypothetical protein
MQDFAASVLLLLWIAASLHLLWVGKAPEAISAMVGFWLLTSYCFKDMRLRLAGFILAVVVMISALSQVEDTFYIVLYTIALPILILVELREIARKKKKGDRDGTTG